MKPEDLIPYINVDEYSSTPKYKQLTNAILAAIESGKLLKNSLLPSINELSFSLEMSRDTAEKGYRNLRKLGVVDSVPGKGYFIINTDFSRKLKVCLLFNKLSTHKKIIYDSFTKTLGEHAAIDFYIYNNDFALFKKMILTKRDDYSHFVIIPHFLEGGENAHEIINTIPKEKLVILDKLLPGVTGDYAAAYENFAQDIYAALEQALDRLSNYRTLKIIFPKNSYFPHEILTGFYRFCQQYAFDHKVIHNIKDEEINPGEVYINLMEDDLVMLIERLIAQKLKIGKDVGVISYNETPLKRIILDGITTISTDFSALGAQAAGFILNGKTEKIAVPFYLNLRKSL
ncbi:GntR family transcriptional regulator [Pedobacter psychrodurus]|uniref:GntR family transcriptional regulator n=1 Tax=Pedobacter psychrodurus TaxID=2530456 RepID=A0A4R0Q738_9SPHI|nr:winged helix-turn-helix domain-containing protein [Pedobacter psychrodurus]TCD29110.1 GntR family transcriptional regulator [Pedobacter psychrodurus]